MRVLVWQWGRYGSAPRLAAALAEALDSLPGVDAVLSLSRDAELLRSAAAPRCHLPVATYGGLPGFLLRLAAAPVGMRRLAARIAALRPEVAICMMPGPLDLVMAAALRRCRVPFVVLVHDAEAHPGDGWPLQMRLQRALCRRAAAVGALTTHVAERLRIQRLAGVPGRPLLQLSHPPMAFDVPERNQADATDALSLLCFGRLLPYKGLDLLAEALTALGPRPDLTVRVVGMGPEGPALAALRTLPGVVVENRWVPEDEVGSLLGWSDALVLPYREASQSGVAAAAVAAGRRVLATRVGGLAEQLATVPDAILCEPDAASLVAALRRLLEERPMVTPCPADPRDAWRDLAASLLRQVGSVCVAAAGWRE